MDPLVGRIEVLADPPALAERDAAGVTSRLTSQTPRGSRR